MSQNLGSIGPYELRRELGRGAMARVWRGYDPNLEREVAIKVPLFDRNLPEGVLVEMGRRFVAEGRAAARLSHPGIVAIYAANVWDDTPAIVMELVEGETLASRIARGPLSPDETLAVLDQLLGAVGYAHEHGIVHRDIKPDNIFITYEGRVKLADFGIARIDNGAVTHATVAGTVLGTPGYMSPEQARGTSVDVRSDLFSIGVIAHEMLTGTNPFGAGVSGDATTLIYRIVHEPAPELPSSVSQALPADIRPAIMAALAKDPDARPQTAEEFRRMLHGEVAASDNQVTASIPATSASQYPQTTPLPRMQTASVTQTQQAPVDQFANSVQASSSMPYTGASVSAPQSAISRQNRPGWLPYALVGCVCTIGLIVALVSALGGNSGGGGGSSYSTYLTVYGDHVAIFTSNSTDPYEVTDVAVSDLSPEDAAELGGRISVGSLQEAESRVEEYQQAIKQAKQEAKKKTAEEKAKKKAAEEAKAKTEAEKSVSITVTGADGTTRTETIHRDPSTQRVIPDSNDRLLSQGEIDALSDAERCIAWNEIIASSNGYAFKNSALASYFGSCNWYHRDPNASSSGNLSGNAARNVDMLQNSTSEWWKHLAAY